jgi:hypothetical protein
MASAAGLGLIGLTVSVLEAHVGRVALPTPLTQQVAAWDDAAVRARPP